MATQVPVPATDATTTPVTATPVTATPVTATPVTATPVTATELDPFAGMLATRAMLGHLGIPLRGARVAVQGFGNVGASAALENVVTSANAARIRATVVCGGANGPTTSAADEILESNGVHVIPDILANAGLMSGLDRSARHSRACVAPRLLA